MRSVRTMGGSLAALACAGAMLLAATTAHAAMAPTPAAPHSNPDIQLAWCAAGLALGPLGGCIVGGPNYYGPGYYHRRHCWVNRWGNRVCNW